MIRLFFFLIIFTNNAEAWEKSICGPSDDRDFSMDKKIGRVNDGVTSVCTVTMIGRSCALSAGHCYGILDKVSFNVPRTRNGDLGRSKLSDTYEVDQYSILYSNNGPGDDYAVFELLPNKLTGKLAGEVQGYYNVKYDRSRVGEKVVITGFGRDSRDGRNHSQQTHTSGVVQLQGAIVQHDVDTKFGNSGSVIIELNSKNVIGIHTHGACYSGGGSNYGTTISGNTRLRSAIRNCLSSN